MSENDLTNFDKELKRALDNYEAPYDGSDWKSVQSGLEPVSTGMSIGTKVLSALGVVALAGTLAYFIGTSAEEQPRQVAENTDKPTTQTEQPATNIDRKQKQGGETAQATFEPKSDNTDLGEKAVESTAGKTGKAKAAQPGTKEKPRPQQPEQDIAQNTGSPPTPSDEVAEQEDKDTEPQRTAMEPGEEKPGKQPAGEQDGKPKPEETPLPSVDFEVSENNICVLENTVFKPYDSIPDAHYSWEFGDGETTAGYKAKHRFGASGNYPVMLKVKLPNSNRTITQERMIVVNPKPVASFETEKTDFHCNNSKICFRTEENGMTEYFWSFGDNKYSNEPNPQHQYNKKGHYNVKLRVVNNYGCADSAFKQVHVMRAYNLLAPNSFSPNGDGINDTWMPIDLQNGNKEFDLKVVDSNGRQVYQTSRANAPWNGQVHNGDKASAGEIFLWRAIVKDEDGNYSEYGGSILIK